MFLSGQAGEVFTRIICGLLIDGFRDHPSQQCYDLQAKCD